MPRSTPESAPRMRRVSRQRAATALVAAAVIAGVATIGAVGAGLAQAPQTVLDPDSQRFVSGYYSPDTLIDLVGHAVDAGTYQISYAADVRFEEAVPGARLICALRDPNTPALVFQPDSSRTIAAGARTTHIEFTGVYALPPMSFGVRCHTSVAGSVRILFSNIQLDTRAG